MYIYLDETSFGGNTEYSGYGCLISKDRISNAVVDEALENLRNDQDRFKDKFISQDDRTLERKFFHAADDSQNAHSHFCNSINKNIIGKFNSHFFHLEKSKLNSIEEAYDLALKLSVLSVFHESQEVVFIFEERNDLTEVYIRKWWQSLWLDVFKSQFNHPYMVTYFPKLKFEIKTKYEPGIQVVDFILWASSRQVINKKCPWLSRVKSWFSTTVTPEGKSWGGHSLSLGRVDKDEDERYSIKDYKHDDPELNSIAYLTHYIVHAQKVINVVYSQGKHDCIAHFWDEIEYLEKNKCVNSNSEHINRISACFLKLFDNVAVIKKETKPDDKAFWLSCRKCLAYALHSHCVNGKFHSIRLSNIRNEIIKNDPEALAKF